MKYSIVFKNFLILLCLKVCGNYGELYGEPEYYGDYGDFGDCAYPGGFLIEIETKIS